MSISYAEALGTLRSMFPTFDDATFSAILRANGGHMERTVEQLLVMSENTPPPPAPTSQQAPPPPSAAAAPVLPSDFLSLGSTPAPPTRNAQELSDEELARELQRQFLMEAEAERRGAGLPPGHGAYPGAHQRPPSAVPRHQPPHPMPMAAPFGAPMPLPPPAVAIPMYQTTHMAYPQGPQAGLRMVYPSYPAAPYPGQPHPYAQQPQRPATAAPVSSAPPPPPMVGAIPPPAPLPSSGDEFDVPTTSTASVGSNEPSKLTKLGDAMSKKFRMLQLKMSKDKHSDAEYTELSTVQTTDDQTVAFENSGFGSLPGDEEDDFVLQKSSSNSNVDSQGEQPQSQSRLL